MISKNQKFILNLNRYRNAHYQVLNKAKKQYEAEIAPLLFYLPKLRKIKLTFIYYPSTRRDCDIANVCCIHDKFFCDSLVNQGLLEDDNYKFIISSKYLFGFVDKENPRVDVIIEEI